MDESERDRVFLTLELFSKIHHDAQDRQHEINTELTKLYQSLSTELKSISHENERLQTRINVLEKELVVSRSNSPASTVSAPKQLYLRKPIAKQTETKKAPIQKTNQCDPCEVLISGVRTSSHLQRLQSLQRILSFVSLTSIISHVSITRPWKADSFTTLDQNGTKSSFVVRFESPVARDAFLTCIRKFKNLNTSKVFGHKIATKISVMNLVPKPTFLLFLKAQKICKSVGYASPLLKNGVVYLRRSPIYSQADLYKFIST